MSSSEKKVVDPGSKMAEKKLTRSGGLSARFWSCTIGSACESSRADAGMDGMDGMMSRNDNNSDLLVLKG